MDERLAWPARAASVACGLGLLLAGLLDAFGREGLFWRGFASAPVSPGQLAAGALLAV